MILAIGFVLSVIGYCILTVYSYRILFTGFACLEIYLAGGSF